MIMFSSITCTVSSLDFPDPTLSWFSSFFYWLLFFSLLCWLSSYPHFTLTCLRPQSCLDVSSLSVLTLGQACRESCSFKHLVWTRLFQVYSCSLIALLNSKLFYLVVYLTSPLISSILFKLNTNNTERLSFPLKPAGSLLFPFH